MAKMDLDGKLKEIYETITTGLFSYTDLNVAQLANSYSARVFEDSIAVVWGLFILDEKLMKQIPEYEDYLEYRQMLWYHQMFEEAELFSWDLKKEASRVMGIYGRMCRCQEVSFQEVDLLINFLCTIREGIAYYLNESSELENEFEELIREVRPKPMLALEEPRVIEILVQRKGRWKKQYTINSNRQPYRPLSDMIEISSSMAPGISGKALKKLLLGEAEVKSVFVTAKYVEIKIGKNLNWEDFEPRVIEIIRALLDCPKEQLRVRGR